MLMDDNQQISFFGLFYKLEDKRHSSDSISAEHKLLANVLMKALEFDEIRGDRKINFYQFVDILKKAMNMRKRRKHVNQIFEIFDPTKNGMI